MTPVYPIGPFEMIRDTDFRRERIKALTDAIYGYLTIDIDEAELVAKKFAENPPKMMAGPVYPTQEAASKALMNACERRDILQQRIQETEDAIAKVPYEVGNVMRPTLVGPIQDELKHVEEWISEAQKQMEANAPHDEMEVIVKEMAEQPYLEKRMEASAPQVEES
jgi:hypothetical protein